MFVAGDRIGAYVVLSRLGAGGMGEVYVGQHVHIGRKAAIKILLPELAARPDVVARFFNEARATGLLRHPNIVEVLDCDVLPGGQAYIVMELLGGESLSACLARLKSFADSPGTALAIAGQIASGLSAAHAKGIVHRDLKPDNIYLVATRQAAAPIDVKVLDFGIAKLLGDGDGPMSSTRTGSLLGTPVYMSPEQCRGAGLVDHRADIYSLGCMLFEMIGGQPPFMGAGPGDLIAAHMFHPVPPLASLAPATPPAAVDLVTRMLAKSPDDRPQTMAEVIAQVEAILHVPAARFRESIAVPMGFPFPKDDDAGLITSQPGSLGTPVAGRAMSAAPIPRAAGLGHASTEARPVARTQALPDPNDDANAAASAPAGSAGGTLVADAGRPEPARRSNARAAGPVADEAPANRADASPTGNAPLRSWLALAVVTVIVAGLVGTYVLRRRSKDMGPVATDAGGSSVDLARADEPASPPANSTALEAVLRVGGEPAWPEACRTRTPGIQARLVNAAKGVEGLPAPAVKAALASNKALPDDAPERWMLEARATLTSAPRMSLEASDRAVALCPSSAAAQNLRGNALQKLPPAANETEEDRAKALNEAANAYQQAAAVAPDYGAPRFNLGLVRLRQDRAQDALDVFEALARANPAYPNIHLVRGEAFRKLGKAAEAVAALEEQVRRQPASADGWWQLSRALTSRNPKQARQALCRAKALGHPAAAMAKGCRS